MVQIIVDTDILIDVGCQVDRAIVFLQRLEKESVLGVSVITQMELIVGCRDKRELNSLDKFLKRFNIISVNEAISDKSVNLLSKYRLSHGLLIADALIASTAITTGADLLTKNHRDYKFIEELKMVSYS